MAILKRPLKLAVLAILVFGLMGFAGAGHAFTTVQAAAAGAPTVTEKSESCRRGDPQRNPDPSDQPGGPE
jgi:hypothetical protein